MTKISRMPVREDLSVRVYNLLIGTLSNLKTKDEVEGFVGSIFTPTERIMFAKRLAAALLLAKGHDYMEVRRILRISPPTIAKMSFRLRYEGEHILPLIENILRRQKTRVIWEEIKDLLDTPIKGQSKGAREKRKYLRRKKIAEVISEF